MPNSRRSLQLLDAYHDRLAALREQAGRSVRVRFRAVELADPADLPDAFRSFGRDAAAIIGGAKDSAQTLSAAFYGSLRAEETGDDAAVPFELPDPYSTSDGRSLEQALAATPAKVMLALKQGKPLQQALSFGRFGVTRFTVTEVMDGASDTLSAAMAEDDAVVGWRWKSRGTCDACAAVDGLKVLPVGQPLERHPYCQCVQEPAFTFNHRVERISGHDRLAALPAAERSERVNLVLSGPLEWEDIVAVDRSKEWHAMTTVAPLAEMRRKAEQAES